MNNKFEIIAVAETGLPELTLTGGVLRASKSLREYSEYFNVALVLPPTPKSIDPTLLVNLKNKLKLHDIVCLDTWLKPILAHERLDFVYPLIPQKILKIFLKGLKALKLRPSVVVVLNEPPKYLSIGCLIKSEFSVPAYALLQLPVFYHDKRRRENIVRAFELWFKELYLDEYLGMLIRRLRAKVNLKVEWSRLVKKLLKSYELLVAVSRAVPIEMGPEWSNRLHVLDPGVSFDEEDIILLHEVKRGAKQEYVVFGGRVDALKGFVEGLYAFKELVKHHNRLKLIVTGHVGPRLRVKAESLIKKLGLEGKVILTGIIPRPERFKIVACAKFMLYPSHVDAFPYAVAESLYLNTPVIAYDIPALSIYYGDNPGVKLVKEGDVEGLVVESLNLLETKDVIVKQPEIRSWNDIMKEEIMLITKLVNRA